MIDYKPHQTEAANILESSKGVLVYHGLGSGKTLTAIRAAIKIGKPAIVVVPASLVDNFEENIVKAGADRKKFTIYSFEKFNKGVEVPIGNTLIVDEAHRIRNSGTLTANSVEQAAKRAGKVILLTATPIQNKPHEVSSLVNTLSGESKLPISEKEFNKRYIEKIRKNPTLFQRFLQGAVPHTETRIKNPEEFKSKVAGLVHFYEPSNTKDYPSVKEEDIKVELSEDQLASYQAVYGKLKNKIKYLIKNNLPADKQTSKDINAFANAVRQISNTSNQYNTEGSKTSPKIDKIVEKIKEAKRPTVVYSNYLGSGLVPIKEQLDKSKISNELFTGELDRAKKKEIIKRYNEGKLKALLVSSAGGEGLDLKNTEQIHITEPHWHSAKLDQVKGRAIRYKSHSSLPKKDRHVTVYNYVSQLPESEPNVIAKLFGSKPKRETSIDEYLYRVMKDKKDLNSQFLGLLQ